MTRKPDIEYIRYYTGGSEALQLEPDQPKKAGKLPKPRPRRKRRVTVKLDLTATFSIMLALVMAALMVLGYQQLQVEQQDQAELAQYITALQAQNRQLEADYVSGYDLETVRSTALALGLVPVAELEHVPIRVIEPVVEAPVAEPTIWETVTAFFESLFA